MDYKNITKEHYKKKEIAIEYKSAYTKLSLHNLRAKFVAAGEKAAIRRALDTVRQHNMAILDIPCGTGKLAELLLGYGSVTAADISEEMISLAKEDYENNIGFNGFFVEDASHLTFPDSVFDTVVSLRLMHRVPNYIRHEMHQEFYRVSRGHLIISFGYKSRFQNIRSLMRRWLFSRSEPIPCPAFISEIRSELNTCGWKILRTWRVLPFLSSEIIFLCQKSLADI